MKKIILIAIILALVVFVGISFVLLKNPLKDQKNGQEPENEEEMISEKEEACINSGGNALLTSCCEGTGDFPDTCLIGACGCSPENSEQVKICDCGPEKCFDGNQCVMPRVEPLQGEAEDYSI